MRKNNDLILGIILVIYILAINLLSSTKIAFSIPIVFVGLALIVFHCTKKRLRQIKVYKKIVEFFKVMICIGLIGFIGIEAIIIAYPKNKKENSDYILILGAGLTNGKTPNLILQGRLNAALKCIDEYDNTGYIVVSGGKGDDEHISEAVAMSTYLIDKGIPKERIIIEDQSRNTNENFKYSKEKIEEHSGKFLDQVSVKIVTTDFHAFRSSILAKKNGYENFGNYSSNTVWHLIPVMYTREAFGVVKSILFD
ncbi:YdcF family protein [Clostridium weizhouense]|uniref:YdcF family protein n=1 Tax=Clostridium weizhouense TaxID=2859781 RepID=A0ABS7APT8_9CLOT|nr:YdcF family protein [Clostridium weizhouense]MBW6410677.1 YdcF family protein [Clostridium weizhouense]